MERQKWRMPWNDMDGEKMIAKVKADLNMPATISNPHILQH
jgi:hypothetical protein